MILKTDGEMSNYFIHTTIVFYLITNLPIFGNNEL